jgi:SpoIIAA-like
MIYFSEDFLQIEWDSSSKAVIMIWKKFVKGEPFKLGLNKGLELIIKQKSFRWLADLEHMQVLSQEDQTWSSEDWFPRAVEEGIRKMAIVMPRSALAKLGLRNVMDKIKDIEIETSYFTDIQSAKKWLVS